MICNKQATDTRGAVNYRLTEKMKREVQQTMRLCDEIDDGFGEFRVVQLGADVDGA